MIDFVRKYNGYQLSNTCKNQVGVKCFLILSPSSGQAEIIFDMVNASFYGGSDFVGVIPFFCTTNSSRIGTKVFFQDKYTPFCRKRKLYMDHCMCSDAGTCQ